MRFRNLAAAVVGAALLALSSYAQTAALEGNVIGEDGKPVQGAVIKLNRTDIKQNFQTKTDKKGHFMYMGLQAGSIFTVAVEINGKQVASLDNVRASLSGTRPVEFDLAKAKDAAASREAALRKAAETGQLTEDLTRGMSAEQKEALEKQLKEQEAALKKNKERNEAYQAGLAALEAKQYDQAIPPLEKAAELDATQMAIWASLGDAYFGRAVTKRGEEQEADTQKGIFAYNKAIELKPTDAAIHNNFGGALAKVKKYPEAQAEMTKAAELDPPGAGKYYYNLGAILTNIGQSEPASEAFKKAIATDINYGDAYYQLGVSLMSQAQIGADGKITPAPGTVEALQKCMELVASSKCSFGQQAKELLDGLGETVQTQYQDPNKKAAPPAPAPKAATPKKK